MVYAVIIPLGVVVFHGGREVLIEQVPGKTASHGITEPKAKPINHVTFNTPFFRVTVAYHRRSRYTSGPTTGPTFWPSAIS